jgi:hypothetical protein
MGLPEFMKNENAKPKIAIALVAIINIFRRPILPANKAERGIKKAKKRTENNCIKKNLVWNNPNQK